jgi:hypothetical protein
VRGVRVRACAACWLSRADKRAHARACRATAQAPRRGLGAAPRAASPSSSGSDSDSDSDSDGGVDASGVLRRGEALGRDGIFVSGACSPPAFSYTHAPAC